MRCGAIIYTRLSCLLLQDKNGQRPDAMAISHEARALLRDARCTVQEDAIGDNASRIRPHTRWKQQYQQQYQDESSSNPSWLLHLTDESHRTSPHRRRVGAVQQPRRVAAAFILILLLILLFPPCVWSYPTGVVSYGVLLNSAAGVA